MTDPHTHDQSFEQIESAIRAAGDYIQPSEDLRPRTLEAARDDCGDRRAEKRLGVFVFAVVMLVMIGSPIIHNLEKLRRESSAPSTTEMQQRGLHYAADPTIGPNWGLSEAFSQLRRLQADRLNRSAK